VDFTRRGRILDAGIDQIRDAWADPDDDEWYRQRPAPPTVPIWVGGHSDAALRRAAHRADGWMPIFLTADRYAEARGRLEAALPAAGRPPGSVTMGAVAFTAVTGTGWSRDDALEWGARLWGLDPSRLDRYLIAGSAEACVEELRRYVRAGAEHVALLLAADDPVAAFGHVARAWV
jgi:alkanesulfonate monooxygenase SsuD/methylene tetrahydromethanopterin reductase-like flavin-dependent oxidoreductase (luciferase family)